MKPFSIAAFLSAGLLASVSFAQPAPVPGVPAAAAAGLVGPGRIDAVTVYRGQALITRVVDVRGNAGVAEIVVTDLPSQVIGGSLFAEGDANVEIRNITYRTRVVEQDVREQVRKFDLQLRDLSDKLAINRRQAQTLVEHRSYLAKLENFTAPTANTELTRGVLNAETLAKLTTLLFEQRETLATKELALAREQRDLDEQIQLVNRQRAEIAGSSSKVAREAVIFVNLRQNVGTVKLNYIVNGASWTPSYNARAAGNDAKSVLVEYNAAIQQMSGEDWKDVQMTLSTATPSLVAMSPTLTEMPLALGRLQPQQELADAGKLKEYRSQRAEANRNFQSGNNAQVQGGNLDIRNNDVVIREAEKALNVSAGELQQLELVSKDAFVRRGAGVEVPTEEDVSVIYSLGSRTSLPSRADRQLIQIASMNMKAELYKVASPVLTPYVYQQAQVTNDSKVVLLSGPVMSFVAGQFVGHGAISTVAAGQPFTVGLGLDMSLRASREIIDRTEVVQGGNRVITNKVRLTIENFGSAPALVRLTDRIPTSKDGGLQITLVSPGAELSADPAYLSGDRKRGILRWDVSAPSQAIGTKAFAVEYTFKVEFDRQMSLTSTTPGTPMPVVR